MALRFAFVIVAGSTGAAQYSTERNLMDSEVQLAMDVSPLQPTLLTPQEAEEAAAASRAVPMPALESAGMPTRPSQGDWENYFALKQLRTQGFTCPGGTYFEPNDGEFLFDCRLWRAAYLHSKDMGDRDYFSHITPEGKDPFDRSAAQGFGTFTENIAGGVSDSAGTLNQWKRSDGHCTNMMKATHNRMGVAEAYVASSKYQYYWTQQFGAKTDEVDTSCYLPCQSTGGVSLGGEPTTAPGIGGGTACTDESTHCAALASAGYCSSSSQYYSYMKATCSKACGVCSDSGTTPSPSTGDGSRCEDTSKDCASWVSAGYCSLLSPYYPFMRAACSKACGLCR